MVVRQIANAQHIYFLPKFQRIEPPKSDEKDLDEKVSCCLVSEFNHARASSTVPQQVKEEQQQGPMLFDNG